MHAFATRKRRGFGAPALCVAVAFCSASHGTNAAEGPRTHTVVIEAMQFTPAAIEVSPGDTIVWVNKDPYPHDVTSANQEFQSTPIAPGGAWKLKALRKGTFPYRCTLHPVMKADLVVK